jgi:hypothetical protein
MTTEELMSARDRALEHIRAAHGELERARLKVEECNRLTGEAWTERLYGEVTCLQAAVSRLACAQDLRER